MKVEEAERIIAEWSGKEVIECPLDWNETSRYEFAVWAGKKELRDGMLIQRRDFPCGDVDLVIVNSQSEGIDNEGLDPWSPSVDANLWFGGDGLFKKIEDGGIAEAFTGKMICEVCGKETFCEQIGTPAIWTLALAAAIKEAE